jgi:hypothetical protein
VFAARAVYAGAFRPRAKSGCRTRGCGVLPCIRYAPKVRSRVPRATLTARVKPPQQPHIVSFRLSPAEFEQLNSHLAETGVNRSDFVRRAVMSMARGEMNFTEVMPMAVTGIVRDVFELRQALAQQAEFIKILAAASVGTAALLMNKEGSTLADSVASRTLRCNDAASCRPGGCPSVSLVSRRRGSCRRCGGAPEETTMDAGDFFLRGGKRAGQANGCQGRMPPGRNLAILDFLALTMPAIHWQDVRHVD